MIRTPTITCKGISYMKNAAKYPRRTSLDVKIRSRPRVFPDKSNEYYTRICRANSAEIEAAPCSWYIL
jgi:hypothetical protein